ncbi:hypothetical protein D081_2251 [Anaerovibrio sp. JC8]|uniref:hypothetical protein n=1 Tax=Anaerovibrio sp. JC8 TaxID=1240085 RepID=UPI000A0B8F6E|nr:hypothetical protein [Anaerovibrio sp. JC8]ORT99072.1 hypothetical protein D081_2251 [Anaerovibrio sp. JC8]
MEATIDRELRDVLIAISVVSRMLADKVENKEGEKTNGKREERNVNCPGTEAVW